MALTKEELDAAYGPEAKLDDVAPELRAVVALERIGREAKLAAHALERIADALEREQRRRARKRRRSPT